jgi:hypothetical protein
MSPRGEQAVGGEVEGGDVVEGGHATTEREQPHATAIEVEMEDASPITIAGGSQTNDTMEAVGDGMIRHEKRPRPATPAGTTGNIFSYVPTAKRMGVTRVIVKDELVQILDGIRGLQLEKDKEEARNEDRWTKLECWLQGWGSQRQIEKETSATREKELMGIAEAALMEASAARRAVEILAATLAKADTERYQQPILRCEL